jgi:hypothetical protein
MGLKKGDRVEVLKQDDDGWWTGRLNGITGLFPHNYVEKDPDAPPPAPPPARAPPDTPTSSLSQKAPPPSRSAPGSADAKLEAALKDSGNLERRLTQIQVQMTERIDEKARLTAELDRLTGGKQEIAQIEANITKLKSALAQVASLVDHLPPDGLYR